MAYPYNAAIPSQDEMLRFTQSEAAALAYMVNNFGFHVDEVCQVETDGVQCEGHMHIHKSIFFRRCGSCRRTVSIKAHTFFQRCHLPINLILEFIYLVVGRNCTWSFLKSRFQWADDTITMWMRFVDELIVNDWDSLPIGDKMIGGPGYVVQIDESKFGKTHPGGGGHVHPVEGVWVFGGIEVPIPGSDVPNREQFFAVPVLHRSRETLMPLVQQFVKAGSIIHCDGWAAYHVPTLMEMGMAGVSSVNHSENFVNPITNVHTNHIECLWGVLKGRIPKQHYNNVVIEAECIKFNWHRRFHNEKWDRIMRAICRAYYPYYALLCLTELCMYYRTSLFLFIH